MKNDPLGAQGKEPAEGERDSAGGGCQGLEMGGTGRFVGTDTPVKGKDCAVTADGGPAAPLGAGGRWGGAAWAAAHGLAVSAWIPAPPHIEQQLSWFVVVFQRLRG